MKRNDNDWQECPVCGQAILDDDGCCSQCGYGDDGMNYVPGQ